MTRWTIISLIVTLIYVIWISRLVSFGVRTAAQIEASTRLTAAAVTAIYNALPPEARQRAETEAQPVVQAMQSEQPIKAKPPTKADLIVPFAVLGSVLGLFAIGAVANAIFH